jgi:hypothetical protein
MVCFVAVLPYAFPPKLVGMQLFVVRAVTQQKPKMIDRVGKVAPECRAEVRNHNISQTKQITWHAYVKRV